MLNKEALAAVANPATPSEKRLLRWDRRASSATFSAAMRSRRVVKVISLYIFQKEGCMGRGSLIRFGAKPLSRYQNVIQRGIIVIKMQLLVTDSAPSTSDGALPSLQLQGCRE